MSFHKVKKALGNIMKVEGGLLVYHMDNERMIVIVVMIMRRRRKETVLQLVL